MTMNNRLVLTIEEAASILKTTAQAVIQELDAGRLRGFRIGGEWRIRDGSLEDFMNGNVVPETMGVISPVAGGPQEPFASVAWSGVAAFDFKWPDGTVEPYPKAFEGHLRLDSTIHHFIVGYTKRWTAGMKDRERVVVFLGHLPNLIPIVEFSGANDFATSRMVASVIKNREGRHVRSEGTLPPEYRGFPISPHRDLVDGPNASNGLAVVAEENDRAVMLRHAVVRAKFKGII